MDSSRFSAEVDEYLATFPAEVGERLGRIRVTLHEAVPGAEEAIRYGVPTLRVDGKNVVHFAGYAKHLAVNPVPDDDVELVARPTRFRTGKGTLRFPLDQPLPYELIGEVGAALARRRRA